MARIRLLLVDDHAMFRDGLRAILRLCEDVAVIGEANDAATAIQLASELHPDLILMDLKLPDASGIQAAREILSNQPTAKIIVLTMYDDEETVRSAIQAGVQGYILKSSGSARLVEAVHTVAAGGAVVDPVIMPYIWQHYRSLVGDLDCASANPTFAQLELKMLDLLAIGKSSGQIAVALGVSEYRVRRLLRSTYHKLGASNRTQAVLAAAKKGLINFTSGP